MTGLSAYLLVAIVGMVTAKAAEGSANGCLVRLRDCRWLLLALLAASGLYSLPELLVRRAVHMDGGELGGDRDELCCCRGQRLFPIVGVSFCILGASGAEYAAYVAWRLALRHFTPAALVVAAALRPETRLSRRVSHLFFGHLGEPCRCGEEGRPLR